MNSKMSMDNFSFADMRPRLPEGMHPFRDFFMGLTMPLKAFRLIRSAASLRKRILELSALVFSVIVIQIILLAISIPYLIKQIFESGLFDSFFANLGAAILTVLFLFCLFVAAPSLFLVPFTDALSIETERILGDPVPEDTSLGRTVREILRSMKNMALRIIVFVFGHAILLIFDVLGAFVVLPLLRTAWTWIWTASANLDIPLARHLYGFRAEARAFRRRPMLFLGFGAVLTVLLWIPVLNSLFIPLVIVASTMLAAALRDGGFLEPLMIQDIPHQNQSGGREIGKQPEAQTDISAEKSPSGVPAASADRSDEPAGQGK